jgi:hypothetical protein
MTQQNAENPRLMGAAEFGSWFFYAMDLVAN